MSDNMVTRQECDKTHEPIAEFKRETKTNFERLHVRIDKIYAMIVGVFFTIAGGVMIQVVAQKFIDKNPPKIEIVIDRDVLNSSAGGRR